MQKYFSHIISFALLLCFCSCSQKKGLPDLRETYVYRDTKPFGGNVAYDIFRQSYHGQKTELIKKQFADNYQWDYDTASVYFNISRNYYVSDRDAEALLEFAYKGNNVFISAENIDTILMSKLYCRQKDDRSMLLTTDHPLRNTALRFNDQLLLYRESFSYFYYPFDKYFSETNDLYARIVGYNDLGKPNFFVFFWGKGRIFFHTEPKAFSNYFLLTNTNYRYMEEIVRMLPASPENIYWDNYHNSKNYSDSPNDNNNGSFSTFSTLMKYPSLARAFLISLFLLLLYIFFNSKRRQRIIPVIKPVENTSIAFAEAIAGLYLAKKDNRLVADKMITYLNEHVRSKYFMSSNVQEEHYADMLSRKSGVAPEITQQLTEAIRRVSSSVKVSDQQLLILNGLIENFFKNKL